MTLSTIFFQTDNKKIQYAAPSFVNQSYDVVLNEQFESCPISTNRKLSTRICVLSTYVFVVVFLFYTFLSLFFYGVSPIYGNRIKVRSTRQIEFEISLMYCVTRYPRAALSSGPTPKLYKKCVALLIFESVLIVKSSKR